MVGPNETAAQCWARLNGLKSSYLLRCERYAALTIPKLVLPEGHNHLSTEATLDYQSLGAVAVNHLNNRLLLALFRPGEAFFRLDPGKKVKAMLAQLDLTEEDLAAELAKKETEAARVLDQRAVRPKLYQVGRHIIVTGNAVLDRSDKENIRVHGIRNFCVKRTAAGKVHTLVIHEKLRFDELEPDVQALIPGKQLDTEVCLYKRLRRQDNGSYKMDQAVDDIPLGVKYEGMWPEDKCPYTVITWDLADEADYATGLVEEYLGDFEALSALSESLLDGSVLTTEMRWLLSPSSGMTIDDFRKSRNGDAVPGQEGDLVAVSGGDPKAIEMALKVIEVYSQRISRGFLLQSAMVRDAERVTAEEIRAIALELETAFGGVYSQLGVGWQGPMARWCLSQMDMELPKGVDFDVTVITGLDALSRNTQLQRLRAALNDLALFEQLPDGLKARMNYETVVAYVGAGYGIDLRPFLKPESKVQQEQADALKQQVAAENAVNAGKETAKVAAQQQQGVPAQ